MIIVSELIEALKKLPPGTIVLTADTTGINHFEWGNLCPFKLRRTKMGTYLYIDDGLGEHGEISDEWLPLDEFLEFVKTDFGPNGLH